MQDNRPAESETTQRFQILSLDGGGIRGLYPAAVLAGLERLLGKPIVDYFDLIAGTSTGGLIALGLGAGMTPSEIVQFYVDDGPRIFRNPARLRTALHLVRRKYSEAPRQKAFQKVFAGRTMHDSAKRLLIPAYDLDKGRVHIFKTRHHTRLVNDWTVPMWEVAMATTAAPTYFPMYRLADARIRLADGGVWANNPVALAVAEARSMLDVPLDHVRVLSLGTTSTVANNPARLNSGGGLQWLRGNTLVDVLLRGQSSGATGLAQHLVGHANLLRHDIDVPDEFCHLDRTDAERLLSLAAGDSRDLSRQFSDLLGDHTAAAFTPVPPP